MNCGCVVVLRFFGGSGGAGVCGEDDREGCRGARGTRYYRRVVPVVAIRRGHRHRERLAGGSRAGASVYLGPVAGDACRSASTAAGCPVSPCPIYPPRS